MKTQKSTHASPRKVCDEKDNNNLKQKHLGCKKSARPIRSSHVTVLATKQFDIRVGQEATNYYYSKIFCNLIIN